MNSRAMQWVYRTVPLGSSLIVAAASFALSFVALRDVAAQTEAVPQYLAWLVPIVIDGGVMCASAVIWAGVAMGRKRQLFPFFVVFVLVAISVVVNAAHAGPSLLAKVIAALPPLVLLATLELVAISTKAAAQPRSSQPVVNPATHTPRPAAAAQTAARPRAASPAVVERAVVEREVLDVEAALATMEADFEIESDEQQVVRRATNSTRRPVRVQATPPDTTLG